MATTKKEQDALRKKGAAARARQFDRDKEVRLEFARRLRQWQEEVGVTGVALAEVAGVTQGEMSRKLNAKTGPSLAILRNLALHFNLDLNWLVAGKPLLGHLVPVSHPEEEPGPLRRGRPMHPLPGGSVETRLAQALAGDSGRSKAETLLALLEAIK